MDGASSASPAATTRMAVTSWPAGVSLRRKPLAPARSASYTYSFRSLSVPTGALASASVETIHFGGSMTQAAENPCTGGRELRRERDATGRRHCHCGGGRVRARLHSIGGRDIRFDEALRRAGRRRQRRPPSQAEPGRALSHPLECRRASARRGDTMSSTRTSAHIGRSFLDHKRAGGLRL
jgi:hypothetical protein